MSYTFKNIEMKGYEFFSINSLEGIWYFLL